MASTQNPQNQFDFSTSTRLDFQTEVDRELQKI